MAKGSKKKAWRRIELPEIEAQRAAEAADERAGGPVAAMPDASLFFEDRKPAAPAVVSKRRLTAAERRAAMPPLRVDVILTNKSKVKPLLATGAHVKPPIVGASLPLSRKRPVPPQPPPPPPKRRRAAAAAKAYDVWSELPGVGDPLAAAALLGDPWTSTAAPYVGEQALRGAGHAGAHKAAASAARGRPPRPRAAGAAVAGTPAVPPPHEGSSYNPPRGAHQDALALAVAVEVTAARKAARLAAAGATAVVSPAARLAQLLNVTDNDDGGGDDDGGAEGGVGDATAAGPTRGGPQRLTRADRNKATRRRGDAAIAVAKAALSSQRRQLDDLPRVTAAIAAGEDAAADRRARRAASREDRARDAPPRLGKRRYTPRPLAVLLSSEVTGSLRALPSDPDASNLRERFNALQRRGMIEPRVPAKKPRIKLRQKTYEVGTRGERERADTAAIMAERHARKHGGLALVE